MKSNDTDVTVGQIVITPNRCLAYLSVALLAYGAAGFVIVQLGRRGVTDVVWTAGDWTVVSCLVLAIVGVWLARHLGQTFDITLSRLMQRGALVWEKTGELVSAEQIARFKETTRARAHRGAIYGGCLLFVLVGCLMAVGEVPKILKGQSLAFLLWNMTAVFVYVTIGFIGGLFIGRAIVYSFLAIALDQEQIAIKIMPGHPDGAAGMKPIGDMFFLQACLAALPAVFVGGWYLMIANSPAGDAAWDSLRENYQQPFRAFFFVMMGFEVLGFILPMWLFHRHMDAQKTELFEASDKLSERITLLKAQIVETTDNRERAFIQSELHRATQRHEDIEDLPTWPVNFRLWRQFVIGNLLLTAPILLELCKRFLWAD